MFVAAEQQGDLGYRFDQVLIAGEGEVGDRHDGVDAVPDGGDLALGGGDRILEPGPRGAVVVDDQSNQADPDQATRAPQPEDRVALGMGEKSSSGVGDVAHHIAEAGFSQSGEELLRANVELVVAERGPLQPHGVED